MLVVLLLIGAVFYMMFLSYYVDYFPNGPNMEAEFEIAAELVAQYGTNLEPDEFEAFEKTLPILQDMMDEYIAAFPLAQKYSYESYAEFQTAIDNIQIEMGVIPQADEQRYADGMRLHNYLWDGETNNILGRVQATEYYIREYESWQQNEDVLLSHAQYAGYSEQELAYAAKNLTEKTWQNIMPHELPYATTEYFGLLLIWMVLSECLLLSPVLVHDRMHSMRPLQWSARRGRGILKSQFGAAMLSTFLLSSINLLILGALFATNGVGIFLNSRVISFAISGFSWVNTTYRGYCLLLIGICYLIAFGAAGMAFVLSRFSGNYIAMLLKLIPLIVLIAIVSPRLIGAAFYFHNNVYAFTQIPLIELIAAGAIFALGVGVCAVMIAGQKKEECLTN
ncbi:MAG: hypothetical protein GX096_09300 [Clostridiales bacterium]|nr:hypothetical protein [Clostridiales bacterium]